MTISPPEQETTRDRVLAVALELFAEKGFTATSTRELSERLGFTKAALYYHFRTKDDILSALAEVAARDLDGLAGAGPARNAAARRALLAGYTDLVAAHSRLIHVISQDPAARCGARDTWRPLHERLLRNLTGQEQPDQVELTRARAALGAIHAALHSNRVDPGDPAIRAAALAAACGALGVPAPRPQH